MVLEEISHLIEDCNSKREELSKFREAINDSQKTLLGVASKRLNKDDLEDLEHYQNQFHIQLINIHDMRHELKVCQHRLKVEGHLENGTSEETMEQFNQLSREYESLESALTQLRLDFDDFISRTK